MHILGKVLVWLTAFTALFAIVLAARLLDIRHSWMKRANAQDVQIATGTREIADLEKQLAKARAQYDYTMIEWDRYWPVVAVQVQPQTGEVQMNLGRPDLDDKDRQGNAIQPLVHLFQRLPDNSYEYVGEFKITRLDNGQSTAAPNWRYRQGDAQKWTPGDAWRARTSIPTAEKGEMADLEAQLVVEDERLAAKQVDLTRQQELSQFAGKHLDLRIGEIEGFEDLKDRADKLPAEVIDGALLSLIKEEELRNAALEKADQLRHRLYETTQRFQELVKQNSRLAETLRPSAPEAPQARVSQR